MNATLRACLKTRRGGRPHASWTAAGSGAPRRFWNLATLEKAVSPLRSAAALHDVFGRACTCVAAYALACCLLALATVGCRTAPPLPKADLSQPDWNVRQGQAVWRAKRDAPEIAGEILLATNANGRTMVQFTKTPFPFVIAQTTTNSWQIESPARNKFYSGRGSPPARVIWFQLPNASAGLPMPKRWSWQATETGWRLENISSGESLEGYFAH